MDDYYDEHMRQPHYITNPKAYVSGLATDPPPTELQQEHVYSLNAISTYNYYYNNEGEIDSDSSSGSEYKIELPEEKGNSINVINTGNQEGEIPATTTATDVPQSIMMTQVAHQSILDKLNLIDPNYIIEKEDEILNEQTKIPDEGSVPTSGNVLNAERIYVRRSKLYPPNLDLSVTAGVETNKRRYTNAKIVTGNVVDSSINVVQKSNVQIIPNSITDGIATNYFSNSNCKNVCIAQTSDDVQDVYKQDVEYIHSSSDQWFVSVPIRYENGRTIKTDIFADPGANSACVDQQWALKTFPNSIHETNRGISLKTPGGMVTPKECLWMTFPTKTGKILKAQMFLIKDLPVTILADINMLRAFGYQFRDETPPVFRKPEENDIDFELPTQDEILSNKRDGKDNIKYNFNITGVMNLNYKNNCNWFLNRMRDKHNQMMVHKACLIQHKDKIHIYDKLMGNKNMLYDYHNGSHRLVGKQEALRDNINSEINYKTCNTIITKDNKIDSNEIDNGIKYDEEIFYHESINCRNVYDENDPTFNVTRTNVVDIGISEIKYINELIDLNDPTQIPLTPLDDNLKHVNSVIRVINNSNTSEQIGLKYSFQGGTINENDAYSLLKSPIYRRCLFIQAKESFKAQQEEIDRAMALDVDKELKWNDISYLKQYPKKYGPLYNGIYERILSWINEYKDIFATHTFSRRTLRVPPAKLGIKPEHRDKTMFAPQYPISPDKRLHMIYYTIKNVTNGFWERIKYSLNSIPYTMVAKKKNGIIVRWRPAFDGRIVNQYCYLMVSNMPTLKDFRDLHSIRGFNTMADFKNFFDCIPLWVPDRKWAVTPTPIGLMRMNCLTYGWKNAAPEAQRISNQVALYVGNCLAYIDDICIKHRWEDGVEGVIKQLKRFGDICRKLNLLVNPSKFFPAADNVESFGFQHTMIGTRMAAAYKAKLLALAKPTTKEEARSFDGMINYMNNYIYQNKWFAYWINKLEEAWDLDHKHKKLKWTPEANFAWELLRASIARSPTLHHPTTDGRFCIQCDACNYGCGAVLWQLQDVSEVKGDMDDDLSRIIKKEEEELRIEKLKRVGNNNNSNNSESKLNEEKLFINKTDTEISKINNEYNNNLSNEIIENVYGEMESGKQWVIVDMWSKIMPTQLRHCNPMVHEAYAVSSAIEHWQFYLIKRTFIVSTDNMPTARVFGKDWKYLNPITQKQLLRLRTKVSSFDFIGHHVKGIKNPIADSLSRYALKLVELESEKKEEDQRFQLTLRAIDSDDTHTPKLTRDESFIRSRAIEESERLTLQRDKLKKEKLSMINCVKTISNIILTPGNNNCIDKTRNSFQRYLSYVMAIDRSWNDLMQNYRNCGNYIIRDKLNKMIYHSDDLLRDDENTMQCNLIKQFKLSTLKLASSIMSLSSVTRKDVSNMIVKEINGHLLEHRDIATTTTTPMEKSDKHKSHKHKHQQRNNSVSVTTTTNNGIVNVTDKDYDPADDLSDLSDEDVEIDTPQRMMTRSRTKKQKEIQQLRELEEKGIVDLEEKEMIDDVRIDFELIRDSMKTRHEFMEQIFGHRSDMDILDLKTMTKMQQGDNCLRLVIQLVTTDRETWQQRDLDLVKRLDYGLHEQLLKGNLIYDLGMLQITQWEPTLNTELDKIVIPFNIRGKLMDYAHHNLVSHHYSAQYTLQHLSAYWWSTMERDVKAFCDRCVSCQFTKGSPRKKTPLVTRELPNPTEHIICDFIGPFLNQMYILSIVDYTTGYCMLVPTFGCDKLVILHVLLTRWVPIFGWFKIFESDWGSGFASNLLRTFTALSGCEFELGEPNNHRGIGKIERINGMAQQIINHYNTMLNQLLTDHTKAFTLTDARNVIDIIAPLISFSLNQRRPRFTTFSPNMLMFGRNMNDITDIRRMTTKLRELRDKKDGNKKKKVLSKHDYKYLSDLIKHLRKINHAFELDWKKYTWLSREYYNRRYKITEAVINRNKKKYKIGQQVLYFIGDRQVAQYKWRSRWTGPWIIDKIINDTVVIIADPQDGIQKRVAIDRIKVFKPQEFYKYKDFIRHDNEYKQYQKRLLKRISKYNVKHHDKGINLDYYRRNLDFGKEE